MTQSRRPADPDGASEPKPPALVLDKSTCTQCTRTFVYAVQKGPDGNPPAPPTCGVMACRALEHWTAEEWAGRARMARARSDAGVPLNDLDLHALAVAP